MLGLGFFFGGIKYAEQTFSSTVSKESGSLILLAVLSMIIPTASRQLSGAPESGILNQSRGTAITPLIIYIFFLFFQLRSHKVLWEKISWKRDGDNEEAEIPDASRQEALDKPLRMQKARAKVLASIKDILLGSSKSEMKADIRDLFCALTIRKSPDPPHTATTFILLILATTLIGFHTTFATDNLSNLMSEANLSSTFVGVVILPMLSNDIGPIKGRVRKSYGTMSCVDCRQMHSGISVDCPVDHLHFLGHGRG